MLTQLYIDNVAVIEHAQVSLNGGLTVLTGETGAGKSILIDALAAVLGERASRDLVRNGCSHALITAVFEDLSASVIETLEEQGFAAEDGVLMLRRRISAENKSLCYIGDQPCTAAVMRSIGRLLVNIHGQHENQALLAVDRHVEYLDRLGGLQELHAQYAACYRRYCTTHRRLRKLDVDETAKAQRMDMLRFQIGELEGAALTQGEEEQLASRRELLHNAEKIARLLSLADHTLSGSEEENGVLSALEQTASVLRDAGRYFSKAEALSVRLADVLPELEDIAATVSSLCDSPEFDPAELDAVEERLALIRRLAQKYGGSEQAAIAYLQQAYAELEGFEAADEELVRLTQQLEEDRTVLVEAATALTAARREAAQVFSTAVCEQLRFLDMPRVTLDVSIETAPMTASGADKVEFLISANPGEPPKPIAKIASGGELSRVMLALKSVLATADDIPTLIFDEVDAGISGRAASKVGCKLRELASRGQKQVLCVTHLAQIAACAHQQLLIEKTTDKERTNTTVRVVEGEERLKELARIIGGEVTVSSVQTAKEMLERLPSLAEELWQ